MRTPHTVCFSGKKVRVKLRSGRVFIDRFIEKKGQIIHFEHEGKIHAGNVAAFTIVKGVQLDPQRA